MKTKNNHALTPLLKAVSGLEKRGVKYQPFAKPTNKPKKKASLDRVEANKRRYLWDTYKITLEYYNKMSENQNHVCAICSKPDKKSLVVDHCHITGRVRGLLCGRCNWLLGFLHDDVQLLTNAVNNLKEA